MSAYLAPPTTTQDLADAIGEWIETITGYTALYRAIDAASQLEGNSASYLFESIEMSKTNKYAYNQNADGTVTIVNSVQILVAVYVVDDSKMLTGMLLYNSLFAPERNFDLWKVCGFASISQIIDSINYVQNGAFRQISSFKFLINATIAHTFEDPRINKLTVQFGTLLENSETPKEDEIIIEKTP